ncbi:hypothetical protein L1887_32657 [Cichorium endivia]|nr:hypothetical protein L1887_32657 [Cichorium endivia]
MASIYSAQGKINKVESIICDMPISGVELTVVTFNAIINARLPFSHKRPTGHSGRSRLREQRYELGRQPANMKISSKKTVRRVCVRGGNVKRKALRLDTGNYSWGSEAVTRKTRILDVVYNASNKFF